MPPTQMVTRPIGITVLGASVQRVPPDLVSLRVAVSRLAPEPGDALASARRGAEHVRRFLAGARVPDVQASRVTLAQARRYVNGEEQLQGYRARIAFHIVSDRLDELDELLAGVVEAGANEVEAVDFQTLRLREVRAEARRQAVRAARAKASLYADAAGVRIESVVHIEDVDPETLRGHAESHVQTAAAPEEGDAPKAVDPGSIAVRGAVLVSYSIRSKDA